MTETQLESLILHDDQVSRFERGNGVVSVAYVGRWNSNVAKFTTGMTILPPGTGIPLHTHNVEESVLVLVGSATAQIGERNSNSVLGMQPGFPPASLIVSPTPGTPRCGSTGSTQVCTSRARSSPPARPSSISPTRTVSLPDGPLHGIRVIDLGRFIAIPYAGVALADMGADVIKVEDPDHDDDARRTGPHFVCGKSMYFLALNWGKRSLAVRLTRPEGHGIVLKLVASADAVIDNFRPGVMGKLGLDHAALLAVNPRIVTCSLTGFGETGSLRRSPRLRLHTPGVCGSDELNG